MKDSAKGMTAQALSWQGLWEAFRAKVVGREFVQDVGVLTTANAVGAVLSFIQAIVVARWLGPKLYGVAGVVWGNAFGLAFNGLLLSRWMT